MKARDSIIGQAVVADQGGDSEDGGLFHHMVGGFARRDAHDKSLIPRLQPAPGWMAVNGARPIPPLRWKGLHRIGAAGETVREAQPPAFQRFFPQGRLSSFSAMFNL